MPTPSVREIDDLNASYKWKKFLLAWKNYNLNTELNKKAERVHVATLSTVTFHRERKVQRQIRPIIGTWHLRTTSAKDNHVTTTERRVKMLLWYCRFVFVDTPEVSMSLPGTHNKEIGQSFFLSVSSSFFNKAETLANSHAVRTTLHDTLI